MKKYLYTIVFVISLFLCTNIVSANYTASVVNPAGAKCSIKNTNGLCFYEDKNLNSVGYVRSLENGDIVTVYTNYDRVPTKNTSLCKDYYVYAGYYYAPKNTTYNGYYCNDNLKTSVLTDQLRQEFTSAGFPASYHEKLAILKTAHPNWKFVAINTGLNFNNAVVGENVVDRSLVQLNNSNNYAYLDSDEISFDYYNDHFNARDNTTSSNPWCDANQATIAYYMDPRNFLSDMYIFQFESLKYDSTITDETYTNLINVILNGDYISKFTSNFVSAGKESKVNPVYLASLSRQEVGVGATANAAVDGKYNGMYNFYNIGATGGANPVARGLDFAANNDPSTLRPWNTEYKAIVGGAIWMGNQYINMGQNTSYFKKWNVVHDYLISTGTNSNPYANYNHQYMSNVAAPSSEAVMTYRSYYNIGLIDSEFTFYIPVYNNMPATTSLPTQGGWPNNYLKSISINNAQVAGFDGGVEVYNYYLDVNKPTITLVATPVSSKAKISGTGTFTITSDTTKNIVVTAENGKTKTYKINIKLTGNKIEDPVDVVTTLNNAGIKNNSKYLSGFNVGTDISYIKQKVQNVRTDAVVILKNSNGKDKNSGKLATGDKVTITLGSDTKNYEVIIYGDATGDGDINALDYVKIRKFIMNTSNLTGAFKEAADANKDGSVNALDYVKIRKFIMGSTSISQ